MSPADWLKRRLGALRARQARLWGVECPAGTPVPSVWRCAALECDSVRLTTLAEGDAARVTCLEEPEAPAAAQLVALGVLPGVELQLVQRYPAFVFRIGHSELAVDSALAARIRVRPASQPSPATSRDRGSANSRSTPPG